MTLPHPQKEFDVTDFKLFFKFFKGVNVMATQHIVLTWTMKTAISLRNLSLEQQIGASACMVLMVQTASAV